MDHRIAIRPWIAGLLCTLTLAGNPPSITGSECVLSSADTMEKVFCDERVA